MLDNKYTKCYLKLIESRKKSKLDENTYYEKHHIVPRCLGGSDEDNNLVHLTPREHFIAHLLLTKMYVNDSQFKIKHAFSMMFVKSIKNDGRTLSASRLYNKLRKDVAKKVGESNKGRIAWNRGIPRDNSLKEAVSRANKGIERSEEEKQKMKDGWANKIKEGYKNPLSGKIKQNIYMRALQKTND
jgi:hypothetical protein